MNKFLKIKERLETDGWWIGFADDMPNEVFEDPYPKGHPHAGKDVDFCKILWWDAEEVLIDPCVPDGLTEEEEKAWEESFEKEPIQYHPIEAVMTCWFSFNGDDKSVENLKAILPIIEEYECSWRWNESADQKINISWW